MSKNELNTFKTRYEIEKADYLHNIDKQINEYDAKINSFYSKYADAATNHSVILSNLRRQYASSGMLNSGAYTVAVKNENERYNQEVNYYSNQVESYNNKITQLRKLKDEKYVKECAFEQINVKYGTSYSNMNKYYNQLY